MSQWSRRGDWQGGAPLSRRTTAKVATSVCHTPRCRRSAARRVPHVTATLPHVNHQAEPHRRSFLSYHGVCATLTIDAHRRVDDRSIERVGARSDERDDVSGARYLAEAYEWRAPVVPYQVSTPDAPNRASVFQYTPSDWQEEAAMQIDFLYFEGCPHVNAARQRLRDALATVGVAEHWNEWDTGATSTPERLRGYASPTILINGVDVEHKTATSGAGCSVGGGPSVERLCAVLSAERR